jgi:hypothetical protein
MHGTEKKVTHDGNEYERKDDEAIIGVLLEDVRGPELVFPPCDRSNDKNVEARREDEGKDASTDG